MLPETHSVLCRIAEGRVPTSTADRWEEKQWEKRARVRCKTHFTTYEVAAAGLFHNNLLCLPLRYPADISRVSAPKKERCVSYTTYHPYRYPNKDEFRRTYMLTTQISDFTLYAITRIGPHLFDPLLNTLPIHNQSSSAAATTSGFTALQCGQDHLKKKPEEASM